MREIELGCEPSSGFGLAIAGRNGKPGRSASVYDFTGNGGEENQARNGTDDSLSIKPLSRYERRKAQRLLDELEGYWLDVILIPSKHPECADRGGMIRAVQCENAAWYRDFCGMFESTRKDRHRLRKFKTRIKRQDTRRGLAELSGGTLRSLYAHRLLDYMRREYQTHHTRVRTIT